MAGKGAKNLVRTDEKRMRAARNYQLGVANRKSGGGEGVHGKK